AASKTEEPTGRKLQQARERGEVVKTPDLPSMASLSAAAAVVVLGGGWICRNLADKLQPFLASPDTMRVGGADGVHLAVVIAEAAFPAVGAVMFAATFAGIFGSVIQTGIIFSPEKVFSLDLSKLSPTQGFKRVFGLDGVAQWIKSLIKVVLTAVLAW